MTTDPNMLEKCAQIVADARRIVCFTGTGMSVESGIGTFRDGSGLWTGALGFIGLLGVNIFDKFYNPIRDAQPNEGHRALVRLQEIYPEMSIVTQNVDEECDSNSRLDCVLFTEGLPEENWIGAELATRNLGPDDVMIIVGTSAQVYPAAGLPELATRRGATLIDVNLEC